MSDIEMQLEDILMNPSSRNKTFPSPSILMEKYLEAIGRESLSTYNLPYIELCGFFKHSIELDAYKLGIVWSEYEVVDKQPGKLVLQKKKYSVIQTVTMEFLADFGMDSMFDYIKTHIKSNLDKHSQDQMLKFLKMGVDHIKITNIIGGLGSPYPMILEVAI